MYPGDPLGNHRQRPIPPALVFEPVLAHEDGMGASAPLPHQGRAGLQHYAGVERENAFLEFNGSERRLRVNTTTVSGIVSPLIEVRGPLRPAPLLVGG